MKHLLTAVPFLRSWRYVLRGVAPLLLVALLSSCLKAPPADPLLASSLKIQAEELFAARDFTGAAATMAEAVTADPSNLQLLLRLGELYEFADQPDKAFAVYAKIPASSNSDPLLRDELSYRAALLLMLKLQRPSEARTFLDQIAPDSPRRRDGDAVLILVNGDPRRALTELNQLSQHPLEQFVGARVAYHAALAFGRINDTREAYRALFQAINLAERSIIARDIERYRDELRQ